MKTDCRQAITRGMRYLADHQQADGGFVSLSSASPGFETSLNYRTTFMPALMLNSLTALNTPMACRLRRGLARFLLRQRSPHWSFNYWDRRSAQQDLRPYPDDLDDTFCALIALQRHNPKLINEKTLAAVIKLLLATESQVGGPYRTWLVAPGSEAVWLDVDLAVNANIAYFLSLVSQPLPGLDRFLDQAIVQGRLESTYYPSIYPLIYYLARVYKGSERPALVAIVRSLATSRHLTALDRALLLTSSLHLDITEAVDEMAADLLVQQTADGSWPAGAFCLDPARQGKAYYHGSPVLTTALVLESLQLWADSQTVPSQLRSTKTRKTSSIAFQQQVLTTARTYYGSLSRELSRQAEPLLDRLATGRNGHNIIALPHHFNRTLQSPLPPIQQQILVDLGLANLQGWIAYTIYDDFLDDEGKAEQLSVANVALRQSLDGFSRVLPENTAFHALVRRTFDSIDIANAWEIAHCRAHVVDGSIIIQSLPDYGSPDRLAERSLGHTLTPLAVLYAHGLTAASRDFKLIDRALRHYLVVRQLNDDSHDWQTDLQNGHISWVVATLLKEGAVGCGTHRLSELMPQLQRQFWHHSLPGICQTMLRYSRRSRRAVQQTHIVVMDNVIIKLLDESDAIIQDTLAKQRQMRRFLKYYHHKTALYPPLELS